MAMSISPHQQGLVRTSRLAHGRDVAALLTRIEIEITTACNLRCYNCDRSSRQAASAERMSVAQVARFVDESLALDWRWRRVTLLGGEPTLHPDLQTILVELDRYRSRVPETIIGITTNGYSAAVHAAIERLPSWVDVRNTYKVTIEQPFVLYNVAPMDLPEYRESDFSGGCDIPFVCGMGLTRYGFYACGAGASADRVLGYDCGVKRLADVTPDALMGAFARLCRYCGHFHGRTGRTELMSPSWTAAYDRWRTTPPTLSLYGGDSTAGRAS